MRAEVSPAVLRDVLSRTLDEAAFVFAEAAGEPPELAGTLVEARLRFAGEDGDELALAAGEGFASTLAANMLGEDEGGAAVTGDAADAVGELLNMVAGVLAVELSGGAAPRGLGLPSVRRVGASACLRSLAAADVAVTLVEETGRRIDLALTRGPGARR